MKIHCLQHAHFEGPARVAEWAALRGHAFSTTHLYRGEKLPAIDAFDMLLLMGGPMSVNDENKYPWLALEKALTRDAIARGKCVLGICLGAQLIASALGARVYRAKEKEIGWFPVRRVTQAGLGEILPPEFTPLHWHGDTFDLPDRALHLAETNAVPNQAFQLGSNTLALQFHIEADAPAVEGFLQHAAADIGQGPFQQSAPQIRDCDHHLVSSRSLLFNLLDKLTTQA